MYFGRMSSIEEIPVRYKPPVQNVILGNSTFSRAIVLKYGLGLKSRPETFFLWSCTRWYLHMDLSWTWPLASANILVREKLGAMIYFHNLFLFKLFTH